MRKAVAQAIRSGKASVLAAVLSEHGLAVDLVVDKAGNTLLHDTVVEGKPKLVEYLLGNNARVNVVNTYGNTPLDEAEFFGEQEMIALLHQAGATRGKGNFIRGAPSLDETPIDEGDENYISARMAAIETSRHPLVDAANNDDYEEVLRLLDNGVDPNARESWGNKTALMVAKNPRIASALVEAGADVNMLDATGEHVLLANARNTSKEDLLAIYIEAGVDLNVQEIGRVLEGEAMSYDAGFTALHYASLRGKKRTVEELVKAGARLDLKDLRGRTPADVADAYVSKRGRGKDIQYHVLLEKYQKPITEADLRRVHEISTYLRTRMSE